MDPQGVDKRYRLRVIGPLPGDAWKAGEFIMIVTAYRQRTYWWIQPEVKLAS